MLQKPSNENRLWALVFETQVKKGTCCCFGFKVEKEQARLLLEAQALPISFYVMLVSICPEPQQTQKGFVLDWKGEGESTTCCRSPAT